MVDNVQIFMLRPQAPKRGVALGRGAVYDPLLPKARCQTEPNATKLTGEVVEAQRGGARTLAGALEWQLWGLLRKNCEPTADY